MRTGALGRPTGIYQGDGTKHYDTPLTQYDYVGMAVPLYRSMLLAGGTGMDEWPGLPTSYAPVGRPGGSPVMTPIASAGLDWRHRTRTDVWRPGIDSQPSTISSSQYALLLEADVADGREQRGAQAGGGGESYVRNGMRVVRLSPLPRCRVADVRRVKHRERLKAAALGGTPRQQWPETSTALDRGIAEPACEPFE